MKMLRQWAIWLTVAGISRVSANQCASDNRTECYQTLLRYHTSSFPLYGQDERTLNETCDKINSSLECIHTYKETCLETGECDDNCTRATKSIINYLMQGEFPKFAKELCESGTELRQNYLEDVECLVKNAEKYAACRDVYGLPLLYTITTPGDSIREEDCCYLLWYRDCLNNVTRETCVESAEVYISEANEQIIGKKAKHCGATFCDKPPEPFTPTESVVPVTDKPDKPGQQAQNTTINSTIKTTINSYVTNMVGLLHIIIMSKYILL